MSGTAAVCAQAAQRPAPSIDFLVEVLCARACARATIYFDYGLETMPEAVDPLQEFAERYGLVEILGQDVVQRILAVAFERGRSR